jgi:hypothetical protein
MYVGASGMNMETLRSRLPCAAVPEGGASASSSMLPSRLNARLPQQR